MKQWLSRATSKLNLCAISLVLVVLGAAAPRLAAQGVIQGYSSDKPLERGMVVALKKDDPAKVEVAPDDDLERIHGVIVDPNDASVTITKEGQKVFVATSGRYKVLVSSQNGPINLNDYISLSSVAGIAAKATDKQTHVLGKALENFDGKTNAITSPGGAGITRITVDIQVGKNPNLRADRNFLPEFLRQAGAAVAGKQVSTGRLYTSLALLFLSASIAGWLLYAGVRNAMISIGRNPLGKKSIIQSLVQVVLFSITVFIIGIFGVYLLLKL